MDCPFCFIERMKKVSLLIALVIAIGGGAFALFGGFLIWQVFGTKRSEVLTVNNGSDTFVLAETVSYPSTAGFRRDAVIRFNNRVVSDSAVSLPLFPLDPRVSAKWRVQKYPPRKLTTNGTTTTLKSWNLYLSPDKFSTEEYDRFVQCYEKNKARIDKILLNSQYNSNIYFVEQTRHIDRIIYGNPPHSHEYVARKPRYEAILLPATAKEVLKVAPDGDWVITKKIKDGSESIGAGKSIWKAGHVRLIVPAGFSDRTGKTASGEKISDVAYFQSFKDAQNHPLTDDYNVQIGSALVPKKATP